MHGPLHSMPPTLQQATTNPRLCWTLLDTHRQVWVSLLWGHCSFLLGPGMHKVLFVPTKSLFPQTCVSSGSSMAGLMATSSKTAYAIPRSIAPSHTQSAAPRVPAPAAVYCWPVSPQKPLKHSSASVSVGSFYPGVHKVCLIPLNISGRMGFDSKHDFTPSTILLGLLCPWTWGISSQSLQHHPAVQRIARRDEKAFLSDQCKDIEEKNRMGKTSDLFKKIRDTKGTYLAKMGAIKDRNGMDLTEAEDTKKKWQEYTELYKKDFHDPDNHDGMIIHLELDILEC